MRGLRERIELAPFTTVRLGGAARYFIRCRTVAAVRQALQLAHERGWPVHVLGGGSNTIFSDRGFAGLVIQVALRGVTTQQVGRRVHISALAGEPWDPLVRRCVAERWAGLECLSGIPGWVGATPIQNVGAYGQQVAETILTVRALDRHTLKVATFRAEACGFAYRQSRFKGVDRDRYIILDVTYSLAPGGEPTVRYPQVAERLTGAPTLGAVRRAVLALRRRKSMLVRAGDPHSRSCGSFFVNPLLTRAAFMALQKRYLAHGGGGEVTGFPAEGKIKVPAAWLVENSGVRRGERRGKVGISPNHALALVNYGGTTAELLALSRAVKQAVARRFGLHLVREPVVVP